MVYFISYGGLLFDLAIVPLLLWKRTRLLAFLVAVAFHLTNWYLFNIGIFPWFMIAGTLLFFSPSWPRALVTRARGLVSARRGSDLAAPGPVPSGLSLERRSPGRVESVLLGILALHVLVQLLVPFRHLLYPGDVAWTEEGHRFSWRMKLRDKQHTVIYFGVMPSAEKILVLEPREHIRPWQIEELEGRPDMILQLAHLMADHLRQQGYPDARVQVQALTSLNGRRKRDLIDPDVDLAAQQRSIWPASWLLPLDEPLRRRSQ
jgi:hypothetical protein